MAIFTNNVQCINTNGNTFYIWAHPISAFMATAGWVQTADTGQVVWPVTIINITQINFAGGTNTVTFTIQSGPNLVAGSTITIKGATNAGNNIVAVVATTNGTTSFTYVDAGGVTETPTALACWGSVYTRVTITNAVGNTSSNTFTYTNTDGTLIVGQSVVVSGCTTAGFNATWTVASINTGAGTFTTTTGITQATEVETGKGLVTCQAAVIASGASTTTTLPPAASNSVYEIWKMNDGNSLPIFLRINYGASATPAPLLSVVLSAGTDGAGNATGGTSGTVTIMTSSATVAAQSSYMSGSTNRLQWALWPNLAASTNPGGFLNIERSHDNNGNDTTTGQYATIVAGGTTATTYAQVSITALNQTVTEIHWATLSSHTSATGSFGLSTLLAPVFPIVGAVGNPMIGLQIGKFADWANATQFSYTMYNTAHNYIIFANNVNNTWGGNSGGILYDNTVPNASVAIRYE